MIIAMLRSVRRPRHALLLGFVLSFATMSASQAAVEISAKPTQNMSCTAGVCSPTAKKAVLNVIDLAGMLAGGDVKITSGSLAQDIVIDAALSWTSTGMLTLDAYRAITFNKAVVVAGVGGLTITTNDGGTDGDYEFVGAGHVEFWDLSSRLFINKTSYALARTFKDINLAVRHDAHFLALAMSLNAKTKKPLTASPILRTPDGFEGLGNTISHLSITDSRDNALVGLFQGSGDVRDLAVINVNIVGTGFNQGVGGLAGDGGGGGGGSSIVQNCTVTGRVQATGDQSLAGGLIGGNNSTIKHSSANVQVSAGSDSFAGGLVGGSDGLIDQSFSTGAVSASDNSMAGGLVGENLGGAITNSYSIGSVTAGDNSAAGGLSGDNADNPGEMLVGRIMTSYSTGTVTVGSNGTAGGFVGEDLTATRNISSSYWDMDASGIGNPSQGAGNIANDPGITGLSDTQLKSGLPAGFDKSIWKEKSAINGGNPYLIANPPPK
jgi:hypothetical protein